MLENVWRGNLLGLEKASRTTKSYKEVCVAEGLDPCRRSSGVKGSAGEWLNGTLIGQWVTVTGRCRERRRGILLPKDPCECWRPALC